MWAPAEQTLDLAGSIVGGQFRLERRLGRGGMGDVYLAEQLDLGRRVVVKMLRSTPGGSTPSDLAAQERFAREARALARLNHPNVVHVYASGRTEHGALYFAMEYLPGQTLGSLVSERGALPEPQVLRILDQLCAALEEAHAQGIIHRDLKPDNVMLLPSPPAQPRIKVLDFGIAQLVHSAERRITHSGEVLGTPLYMAPEQLGGRHIDERTDLYAVGLIGYELLTGEVPFAAATTAEVLARAVREDIPVPSAAASQRLVSHETDALIVRCLQRDPDRRFASASALRDAIADALQRSSTPSALSVRASATPSLRDGDDEATLRMRRSLRRRRSLRLGMAALLVLGGIGAASVIGLVGLPTGTTSLGEAGQTTSAPRGLAPDGERPLVLKEWVQGIPFPEHTDYVSFEPDLIEARVPATTQQVLAFYRTHLAERWRGYEELATGMLFDSPDALIQTLSVVAAEGGSRLLITRKSVASANEQAP